MTDRYSETLQRILYERLGVPLETPKGEVERQLGKKAMFDVILGYYDLTQNAEIVYALLEEIFEVRMDGFDLELDEKGYLHKDFRGIKMSYSPFELLHRNHATVQDTFGRQAEPVSYIEALFWIPYEEASLRLQAQMELLSIFLYLNQQLRDRGISDYFYHGCHLRREDRTPKQPSFKKQLNFFRELAKFAETLQFPLPELSEMKRDLKEVGDAFPDSRGNQDSLPEFFAKVQDFERQYDSLSDRLGVLLELYAQYAFRSMTREDMMLFYRKGVSFGMLQNSDSSTASSGKEGDIFISFGIVDNDKQVYGMWRSERLAVLVPRQDSFCILG